MNTYEKQAKDFLTNTNTILKIKFLRTDKYFSDDDSKRDIYEFFIIRDNKVYTSTFGQSLMNSAYYVDVRGDQSKYRSSLPPLKWKNEVKNNTGKPANTLWMGTYTNYSGREYLLNGHPKNQFSKYPALNEKGLEKYCELKKGSSPTEYDILASIEKYDPEDFESFCDNYGYYNDSIEAGKLYHLVKAQFNAINEIFNNDEIEILQEIH